MLHGGTPSSTAPVGRRSASWHRMAAVQRAVTPDLHAVGASTWLLRYGVRGWNAGAPVADVHWALEQARRELPDVPVVLLGHSMGARAAVHVAGHASVVGVVALAPWWLDEPVHGLRGRHVAAAHGRSDKITSARATRRYLERAATVAATTEYEDMGRVGHYLLRRTGAWESFASSRARRFLEL
ncbi:MAG: alpha/beta hydrolase [Nocardioides sp.]|nr:alpha/beta hydrolase [Nocardioides sp.]